MLSVMLSDFKIARSWIEEVSDLFFIHKQTGPNIIFSIVRIVLKSFLVLE